MKRIVLILLLIFVSSLMAQEGEIVPFRSNRSIFWGYKNQTTGEIIVEPTYQEAKEFDGGLARVKKTASGESSIPKDKKFYPSSIKPLSSLISRLVSLRLRKTANGD